MRSRARFADSFQDIPSRAVGFFVTRREKNPSEKIEREEREDKDSAKSNWGF